MTRKDYVAIAAALKDCHPLALSEIGKAQRAQHDMTVAKISEVLAADNQRFDRARFLKACGLSA